MPIPQKGMFFLLCKTTNLVNRVNIMEHREEKELSTGKGGQTDKRMYNVQERVYFYFYFFKFKKERFTL